MRRAPRAIRARTLSCLAAALLPWCCATVLHGQELRVLQRDPFDAIGGALAIDRGAAGLHQRLLELRTTASAMQVTAHPDDEQSGLLTLLSRGTGARTALLTLNRGEGGANAVGSELFDALGLLRAQELRLAGQYYGLDDQYFTAAVDYGFSKTMAEAARSWDTTAVLGDMVRSIRENQPLVVISRWYGGARDGHGHHQLAGVLTPLAVAAAADSTRFPQQLAQDRLRPWRVQRLLRANLPADAPADYTLDAGRYDPWLGESYQSFGGTGLSRQRSQSAGRSAVAPGPAPQRLQQLTGPRVTAPDDLFAGLETSLPGLFALVGEAEPAGARALLRVADEASRQGLASMKPAAPWEVISTLLTGLRAVRALRTATGSAAPRAEALLAIKERQFERAIAAALALHVSAVAGEPRSDGHPPVPGETMSVQLTVSQESPTPVTIDAIALVVAAGWPASPTTEPGARLGAGTPWRGALLLSVPATAEPTRPPFYRERIAEHRYRWRDNSGGRDVEADAPIRVRATLRVDGEPIAVERIVRYRRSDEPEGVAFPRLVVLPPVSLRVLPAVGVVPDTGTVSRRVSVEVTGNDPTTVDAVIGLESAGGGRALPTQSVRVAYGARATVTFDVTLPRDVDSLALTAYARVGPREWRDDVSRIEHRELERAYLYATPMALIRRVPVSLAAGLRVAYVMGVGDLVPDAITQLGASVTLLDAAAVSAGDFARFDALVIGTRAYAVRPELAAATSAVMAYARAGGSVVVLYQTPEFRPGSMAPFAAELPGNAEETSEEDAEVRLLAPEHPLLSSPNRITARDFDGWIEQRGSKFLTQLSPQYVSLVETHDAGQAPQTGVWVSARVGAGRWSYVALALHRQLPYAVPGAYRILANLLSRPGGT